MPVIGTGLWVKAPPERVFDLSRSVDLHVVTAGRSREQAVGGKTEGLLRLGDEVTWEATHFAVRQRLTSRITRFDRPHHFRDTMVSGAFRRFDHDHSFKPEHDGTRIVDHFDYTAPLAVLGRLANALFLISYMRRFLAERNRVIKEVAESDAWRAYVN